jgi:hypothetical protein
MMSITEFQVFGQQRSRGKKWPVMTMPPIKGARKRELMEKARAEERLCENWLLPFMQQGRPKFATKAELRAAAIRQFGVSKSSFDRAWIGAIIETGREDWYEPLRQRRKVRV